MLEKTEHVGLYHSTLLLKSRDKFTFVGHFPIHTCPTFPSTSQTTLDACIQNFSPVLTLRNKIGKGGPQAIFEEDALFYEGHPKITENYE